ncbi:hypothetical protein M885DRAFT_528161 [Pelagophyceae sp. CCMP2097]|nr:hypothetical protein M885DRAFT_528161 [Pelagophyceae sp. CCMP2097]
MAVPVIEIGTDGAFDIDDVPDSDDEVDDDTVAPPPPAPAAAAPAAPPPAPPAAPAPAPARPSDAASAAGHTYDTGYQKWEKFDADDEASAGTASTERAKVNDAPSRASPPPAPAAPPQEDVLDMSLGMFETIPKDQQPAIRQVLLLSEEDVKSLDPEQAEMVLAFRHMYKEQLEIKRTKGSLPPAPPKKKEDAAARERKPFEQVHAEIEKMMSWPSFRDSTAKWEALQKSRHDADESLRRSEALSRGERVDEAFGAVRTTAHTAKARRQVEKKQSSLSTRDAASTKKDRTSQLDAIRKLAASGKRTALF